MPTTEKQTRQLSRVEPEHQGEVWQEAVATAPEGKVTAAYVRQTVEQPEFRSYLKDKVRSHQQQPRSQLPESLIDAPQCDECGSILMCPECSDVPRTRSARDIIRQAARAIQQATGSEKEMLYTMLTDALAGVSGHWEG